MDKPPNDTPVGQMTGEPRSQGLWRAFSKPVARRVRTSEVTFHTADDYPARLSDWGYCQS